MAKAISHDWVDGVDPEEVRKMIERTFAFLVSEFSFRPPEDQSINTMVIALSYSRNHLAIEPLVDRKDRFVEICVVRLNGGERPEGWKIDNKGDQFMTRLFEAAWDRGLKRSDPPSPPTSPQEALQALLDEEVSMLRTGFPDFLDDDAHYFGALNDRRRSDARLKAERDFFAEAERLFRAKDYRALNEFMRTTEYTLSDLWQARLTYARNNA